jgi:hypothetical protein
MLLTTLKNTDKTNDSLLENPVLGNRLNVFGTLKNVKTMRLSQQNRFIMIEHPLIITIRNLSLWTAYGIPSTAQKEKNLRKKFKSQIKKSKRRTSLFKNQQVKMTHNLRLSSNPLSQNLNQNGRQKITHLNLNLKLKRLRKRMKRTKQ